MCRHCGATHASDAQVCPVTGDSMQSQGPIGARFDRYEVQGLLGVGGFGAVYRARHVHTDAQVALKVLKRQLTADPAIAERFLREAKAASAVGDERIVRVTDAGVLPDGQCFLTMELLQGSDLKDLLHAEGRLPPVRAALITAQVLDALAAAHEK